MPSRLRRSTRRRRTFVLAGLAMAALIGVTAWGDGSLVRSARAAVGGSSPTPSNEDALTAAAQDAQSVSGGTYYAGSMLDDSANVVDLYLVNAPQTLIDQLNTLHPGMYQIHNNAPATLVQLMALQKSLPVDALASQGVDVTRVGPTADGHLIVGVSSNLAAAQSALTSAVDGLAATQFNMPATAGSSILQLVQEASEIQTSYRYDDSVKWNAGDFIYWHVSGTAPESCSSGINVKAPSGNTYMLSSAHCFAVGNAVHNGYVEDDEKTVYGNGDPIGTVSRIDRSTDYNNPATDSVLVPASTGSDVFKSAWNSTQYSSITGETDNEDGQHVCASGAFDGEACFLEIYTLNQELEACDPDGTNCSWVYPLGIAYNPNNSQLVATGQGDSGGPVYYVDSATGDYTARGMIESGAAGAQVPCTSTPPNTSGRLCFHELAFVQMGGIDTAFGVSPIDG